MNELVKETEIVSIGRNTFPILNYVMMLHSFNSAHLAKSKDEFIIKRHLIDIKLSLSLADWTFIQNHGNMLPTLENNNSEDFINHMNKLHPQPKREKVSMCDLVLKHGKL